MEKVVLRVYCHEIESMIEGGELDKAVAHCQHILKTFPMHVETYRLLGKAFLEGRRYADAADIFQRVLLAVPDDFMSHLGMSIIRDDQGRLNDAIWHMERALAIQPSNSAIQSELRRLYGKRDGVEPSKIRLGRDALANMYSQGELFPQAIAEFRSLLAEDPNRPDLQVMLMRAYYRSGQTVEAKEIATALLKKYPYCLDALRVFVDVLHENSQDENAPVFRHRLFMLDPYSSSSLESVFASDQVADSAVSFERLDFKPGVVSGSSQPDWASSLGIKLDSERFGPRTASAIDAETVPFPDWMRPVGWQDASGEAKDGSADVRGTQPVAPIGKADLPEWLMSEDPAKTDPEANQEPEFPSENPPEELTEGEDDIPDWLKAIYPPETTQGRQKEFQASDDTSTSGGDELFKQIASSGGSIKTPEQPQETFESLAADGSDIPDWLKPVSPVAVTGDEMGKFEEHAESQPAESEQVPDFLKSAVREEAAATMVNETQKPENALPVEGQEDLGFLEPTKSAEAIGEELLSPPGIEKSSYDVGQEISDYAESKVPAEVAGASEVVAAPVLPGETVLKTGSEPAAEEASSPEGEAFPDWMKEIGAGGAAVVPPAVEPVEGAARVEQVASEQPIIEPPSFEQPIVDQPTIEQAVPAQPALEQPIIEPPSFEQPIVDQPTIEQAVPVQPVSEGPEIEQPVSEQPDLAQSVEQETLRPPVTEPGILPLDRTAEIPEWLEEPGEKPVEASEVPVQELERSVPETAPLEPAGGEEDTLAWLEQLSADQETTKETPLESPERNRGAAPEVDQEVSDTQPVIQAMEGTAPAPSGSAEMVEEAQSQPSIEPAGEEKPPAEEELPEWLKGLGGPSGPDESLQVNQDLPDWLGNPLANAEGVPELPGPKATIEVAGASEVVAAPVLPGETVLKTGSEPAAEEASSPEGEAFPDWMKEIGAGGAAVVPPAVEPVEGAARVEQVASEQPIIEPPSFEQPIVDQPTIEQAVPAQPALEQPIIEPPSFEQPIVDQPTIEQAVPVQPVSEGPEIEQPVSEQPDLAQSVEQETLRPPVTEPGILPLDRTAEIPEWLEEPGEKPVEASEVPVQESERSVPETAPLEPAGGEEDTLAWLEQLSADQETTKETPLESPERNRGAAPEVDQEVSDTQPVIQAMEGTAPAPSGSAEMVEEAQSQPSIEPAGEEKPPAEEELPEWLKGLGGPSGPGESLKDVEDVPESQGLLTPTTEPGSTLIPEEPIWEDENIPVIRQAVPTTPEEWVPAESKEIAATESGTTPESKKSDETLLARGPGSFSETIQVSKPEPPVESAPVAQPEPSSEIMPIAIPESPPESPTIAESEPTLEILPNSAIEPVVESEPVPDVEPAIESAPVSEPALPSVQALKQTEIPGQIDILSSAPSHEKDSELLANAQTLLAENSLDESLKQYSKLIKKGHLLDEVTKDLREATHRYPVDINIWQTLGDAYMRANRLEDALDAYTRGEELLR